MALNIATREMKNELLMLKKEELTISKLTYLFGKTTKKESGKFILQEPKYKTNMKLFLKAGDYINKKDVETNIGIFIFNKLMIENRFEKIVPDGYLNEVVTKKTFEKLMGWISTGVMNKTISINPEVIDFLKDYEFYGLKAVTIFSPSYSMGLIKPNQKVEKDKKEYLKNHEIKSIQDISRYEDKIVADAKKITKDDPAMALYDSGARGSFDNDYKNMTISVGGVQNPITGQYDFIDSNYITGLQKKDLVAAGNLIVTSEFPKAVGTQVGGYLTKQFYAVYQSIVIDKQGSDCGTNQCLEILLTEDLVENFLYQYIRLNNGKLVLLTEDNAKDFINKMVHFRSPMFCTTEKICNKCAGERFTTMGIENIGLTTGKISNNLLNKRMKIRHSMKVKMDKINENNLLL